MTTQSDKNLAARLEEASRQQKEIISDYRQAHAPYNGKANAEDHAEDKRVAAFRPAMVELRQEAQAERDLKGEDRLYRRAFDSYLRRGLTRMPQVQRHVLETRQRELSNSELRDLGVATGGVGGYLAPQQYFDHIVAAQRLVGGVRLGATIFRTDSGAPAPVPMINDTAVVGEQLVENTIATVQDLTVTSKTLGGYIYSSKIVKASIALVQDIGFDMDTWLAHALGVRLGRIQGQHLLTGSGVGQPQGLFTSAAVGKVGIVGQTTGVIYADLADLVHAVDPFYRGGKQLLKGYDTSDAGDANLGPNPVWVMHDSTLQKIAKLVDTAGRPLYQAGLAAGAPDSVLGYPVILSPDAPVMAANARSIWFGDISNYVVREARSVSLLVMTERFIDSLENGYLAWQRMDGAWVGPTSASAVYVNSAT